MKIEEFNLMGIEEARALVRSCADVPSWAEAVVDARPYVAPDHLVARADELAAGWSAAEVEQALADHPRIGESHAGAGASAEMSGQEQSGVDPTDTEVASRLAAGNRAYEERFGRIFLVRAAGRSAEEILDQLEQRLGNDPDTELEATARALREIAGLRLDALFA